MLLETNKLILKSTKNYKNILYEIMFKLKLDIVDLA